MSDNNSTSKKFRVRFAPSPTGYLHVGGARTALFNYLYAKANGGEFLLRIEDTDQGRSTPEAEKQVLDAMEWMGLTWDEGPYKEGRCAPYRQSERISIYNDSIEKLLSEKKCYRCFCTSEELAARKEETHGVYDGRCRNLSDAEIQAKLNANIACVVRFAVPNKVVEFDDIVRGKITVNMNDSGDFVVRKSDGFPTYNFACAIDDALMEITHVLRGDDHISNTPKQIVIYEALGKPVPVFGHISMILGENREKLSKRHGATSVLEFHEAGYLKEALLNHLVLLGWTAPEGKEILSMEDLVPLFKNPKFHSAPAVFDYSKLDFLNAHYIRECSDSVLFPMLRENLSKAGFAHLNDPKLEINFAMVKSRLKKTTDIGLALAVFYNDEFAFDDAQKEVLKQSKGLFELALHFFEKKTDAIAADDFNSIMNLAKSELAIKGKAFFHPMRFALTGEEHGLELADLLPAIGKERVMKRLRNALDIG